MASEFKLLRRVEFAETDMAGILHFSNYFRYMEEAEHAFFRSLGHRVHQGSADAFTGWARGHAECSYAAPLRYEDRVELHVRVLEVRNKSITYEVVFGRLEPDAAESGSANAEPVEVARGRMTAVHVEKTPGGRMRAAQIPAAIAAAVQAVEKPDS